METGKALEIVHAMAKALFVKKGEFIAKNPAEAREALDTVEDLIVNTFGTGEELGSL